MRTNMCCHEEQTNCTTEASFKCKTVPLTKHSQRKISLDNREDIVEYCKSIVGTQFYGEVSRQKLSNKQRMKKTSLLDVGLFANKHCYEDEMIFELKRPTLTLGVLLKDLHSLLQHLSIDSMIWQQEVEKNLLCIAQQRKSENESTQSCYKRLLDGFQIVYKIIERVKIYKYERVIKHGYWGSRQQLRAGKVIADHVTEHELDPVFGVLLCPSAGQKENHEPYVHHLTNATEFQYSNSCDVDSLPISYHYTIQDAFKYLKDYHDIGPGMNYLDEYALLYSGDVSGDALSLTFWERLINRIIEEEINIEVKKL